MKELKNTTCVVIAVALAGVGEVNTISRKRESDEAGIAVKGIARCAGKTEHTEQTAEESGGSLPHDQFPLSISKSMKLGKLSTGSTA